MVRRRRVLTLVAIAVTLAAFGQGPRNVSGPRFMADDPVWDDNDRVPFSPAPKRRKLSQVHDLLTNTFDDRGDSHDLHAVNANTLGGTPDSSWFTNRHGVRQMTTEELDRGPLLGDGPDTIRPWTIVAAKTEGISPGFTIRDSQDVIYFIKFDPRSNPEMLTGAEAIGIRFFHAFGYNVPENYITVFERANLKVGDKAILEDTDGKERKMRSSDIDDLLEKVPQLPDGRYRAIASRGLLGDDIGPFRYHGTRADDPNDIFPHEDRRELRGLRLFCAWLNHDDSRAINTLDMFLPERYVRHHLIDFGSILGSGSLWPQSRRDGNEYKLDWKPVLKRAFSLGLYEADWQAIRYPRYPSVGRLESSVFQAEKWRPLYPCPPFVRMDDDDAFWAARIIMRFSDEQIATIVRSARYSDPAAADYVTRCLIERRDKIGRTYLTRLSPLSEFEISGEHQLAFKNLAVQYGFGRAPAGYRARWMPYDNDTRTARQSTDWATSQAPSLPIPSDVHSTAGYHRVEVVASDAAEPYMKKPAFVYIRNRDGKIQIVGITRQP